MILKKAANNLASPVYVRSPKFTVPPAYKLKKILLSFPTAYGLRKNLCSPPCRCTSSLKPSFPSPPTRAPQNLCSAPRRCTSSPNFMFPFPTVYGLPKIYVLLSLVYEPLKFMFPLQLFRLTKIYVPLCTYLQTP